MNTFPDFLVRIHCITYNHASYIEDAMNGFCMQQTKFPFVATIIDDASTDGEPEVIRNYLNVHFDLSEKGLSRQWENDDAYFIYAQHKENKNCYFAVVLLKYNFWQAKKDKAPLIKDWTNTKYVAFCEGDDYWTDSNKIERQMDFLNVNGEYIAVAENGMVINTITKKKYPFSGGDERDINIEELVRQRQFPTASVACRNIFSKESYLRLKVKYDTMTWCYLAANGRIKYFNYISSVYRRGKQGITESTEPYKWAKTIKYWNNELMNEFGHLYDTKISKQNVTKEYERSLHKYLYSRRYNNYLLMCIFACIQREPIYTIKILFTHFKGELYHFIHKFL